MNCKIQATTLLALAFVCAYFPAEATTTPPRCLCFETVKMVPFRYVEDFLIIPKEGHCPSIQIILTINMGNSEVEVCLNPNSKQGRMLVGCWERIGHDLVRKVECIRPRRKREAQN
ncbi:uncharacterized protein LOC144668580 [Cetorhinus maximus]